MPSRSCPPRSHRPITTAGGPLAVASALLLAGAPLRGQETAPPPRPAQTPERERPNPIPEVLVTETSLEVEPVLERVPLRNTAGRDLISPREVAEAGTLNLQELFRRSPSVHISEETGSDSLPNLAIRGVTGNDGIFRSVNVAMFADGIPLAGGPYGAPGASGFPLLMERVYAIDVQRGGAATRYGPNNVSGIVNFLTHPIPERPTLYLRASYDSFDDASLYTSIGGTYDRFGFLLEAVDKQGETYRDHGDYHLQNHSLKLRFAHAERTRSFLQVESFDDDSDLADGLSLAQYQADPWQSTSLENRFTANQRRVNHRLEHDVTDQTTLALVTYYYETERTFYLGSPLFYGDAPTYVQATPRPMTTWAVQPQITHRHAAFGGDGTLIAGLHYADEDLTRRVERDFPDGSHTELSDDRFDYEAWSAFVQDELVFGDWTLVPGLRIESVDIHGESATGFENDQDFVELLPALSASCSVRPDVAVYANVQSSFQPPAANVLELSGDPQEIEAQYAWMYEVGARAQTEDGSLAADLALYQIDYSDRLEPDPDQFDVLLNSGRSRHRGIELALDGETAIGRGSKLGWWATAAYNESTYENGDFEGNATPGSPRWLLGWGARYEHADSGLFLALDGGFVDESYSDRENTADINAQGTRGVRPSTTLWNAHAGVRRAIAEGAQLEMQADARNLFDEDSFDVRAGRGIYPGAPFGYGLTMGLRFTF